MMMNGEQRIPLTVKQDSIEKLTNEGQGEHARHDKIHNRMCQPKP